MRRLTLTIIFALLFTEAAYAHPDPGHALGLLNGFAHPLAGLDHVVAMLAVGVFAAALGGRALWLVPLSFVGAMVVGFLLGLGGVTLPFAELVIASSGIVIGALAILRRTTPVPLAMALVGLFAVFHGNAHGAEMPKESGAVLYAFGFIAATMLLHGIGLAVSQLVMRPFGKNIKVAASNELTN
jgi:urease accessory protein